jgi:hypothetical protein
METGGLGAPLPAAGRDTGVRQGGMDGRRGGRGLSNGGRLKVRRGPTRQAQREGWPEEGAEEQSVFFAESGQSVLEGTAGLEKAVLPAGRQAVEDPGLGHSA